MEILKLWRFPWNSFWAYVTFWNHAVKRAVDSQPEGGVRSLRGVDGRVQFGVWFSETGARHVPGGATTVQDDYW